MKVYFTHHAMARLGITCKKFHCPNFFKAKSHFFSMLVPHLKLCWLVSMYTTVSAKTTGFFKTEYHQIHHLSLHTMVA